MTDVVDEGGGHVDVDGTAALRSSGWSAIGRILPALYTTAISVAAARALGPQDMGRQSYIAWVAISLGLLANSAAPQSMTRFVAEAVGRGHPQDARTVARWGLRVQLGAAIASLGVLGAIAAARPELRAAWLLAAVSTGASILLAVGTSLLTGLQRWRSSTIVGLVTGGAGTVATLAVLAAGGGITAMFAVEALVGVTALTWMSALALRHLPDRARAAGDPVSTRPVRRFALLSLLEGAISLVVWRRSEFFFLERWSPPSEIAIYSIAFSLLTAVTLLPDSLAAVVSPAAATLVGRGRMDRVRGGYARALRIAVAISLPLAGMIAVFGPALLRLVYGDDYRRAGDVVVVLALAFPFVPVAALASSIIVAIGNLRWLIVANLVAAAVDIVVAAWTVADHGAIGAAWANSAGVVVAAVLAATVAAKLLRPFPFEWTWIPGPFLAAVAVSIGLLPLRSVGDLGGLALGGLASVGAVAVVALLVPVVPLRDADWVVGQAGAVGGPLVAAAARRLTSPRLVLGQRR